MRGFANAAESIASTRSKLAKVKTLAEYFQTLPDADLHAAAVFFTGRPFPLFDARTLKIGGAALVRAIQGLSGATDQDLHNAYMDRADLGEVAEKLLPHKGESDIRPSQVLAAFEQIVAASGAAAKLVVMTELLGRLPPLEAKYIVKIVTGDMRIGLKENTVEEAIAKAFDRSPESVRRANMSLGDIGETAVLARRDELEGAQLTLFRPVKFMLATPVESEDDIFANFAGPFFVEDKYDGIRGQMHIGDGRAAIYSRTLDDVSSQFPEIVAAAAQWPIVNPPSVILDGEVVAYRDGQVLPFSLLQTRLGRKKPSQQLMQDVPVVLMVFDLLSLGVRTLIDESLLERKKLLRQIEWSDRILLAPFFLLEERVQLEPFFVEAAERRNEGLMLKDADSAYAPGKRGMSWLKWKKALATLDVVVTGVEYGHGRRRDVLSDYTFAVQQDGRLVNIGKAYSGLTDQEIADMTEFFKAHTIQDYGRYRVVEPTVVLEVAFNGIQKSGRHESGFALRFPRIVRLRPDKRPADADTIETVHKIYASHVGAES